MLTVKFIKLNDRVFDNKSLYINFIQNKYQLTVINNWVF